MNHFNPANPRAQMRRLVYHPPKSVSHAQGPRARSARKAWQAIQSFLREHSIFELRLPVELSMEGRALVIEEQPALDVMLVRAGRTFGPPTSVPGGSYVWYLTEEQIPGGLEFVFEAQEQAELTLSPHIYFSYSFTWKDMRNPPPPEPGQHFQRGSTLAAGILGRRFYIQPTFLFAVQELTPAFVADLRLLEAAMPFAARDEYYQMVENKKSGTGTKLTKLKKGWKTFRM